MKKGILAAVMVFLAQPKLQAQDNLGMASGNFGGINASFLNPCEIANGRTYLDINLLSGNLYIQNNYIRLPSEKPGLSQNTNIFSGLIRQVFSGSNEPVIIRDTYTTPDKWGFAMLRLTGPSFIYSLRKHAFGFQTSFRTFSSGLSIPFDIAKFAYEGLYFSPQHFINYKHNREITAASLGWNEIGLTYANTIVQTHDRKVAVGMALKALLGYHAIYLHSRAASYMVPDRDTINIYYLDAEGGISLPIDYGNNSFFGIQHPVRGYGMGIDLGISYSALEEKRWRKLSHLDHFDAVHKYRLGFSLVDMGLIRFNKHSKKLRWSINDTVTWGGLVNTDFNNTNHYIDTMSWSLTGRNDGLDAGKAFSVLLPAAAVMTFDYKITDVWFVNAVIMQNIPYASIKVSRPSYIALIPRYETDYLSILLPLILYEYREPRLGIAARYRFITIGTDRLGAFLGRRDYNGFSFYFSIKSGLLKLDFKRSNKECQRFMGVQLKNKKWF